MAARFWVGGHPTNDNWNQAGSGTTNWSATSGGAGGASVPTSTDDVTFDGAGGGNSTATISATITVLSFTVTGGYTSTITHNAVLTVAGNVTLNTSYTIAGSSGLTINATSTITSGGKTWPNAVTFSGALVTKTLVGNFTILGTLTCSGSSQTINKTTTETLTVGGLTVSENTNGTIDLYLTGGTWSHTAVSNKKLGVNLFIQGNVTLGATVVYGTNTLTYVSGTVDATTNSSTLYVYESCTLDTNGINWNNITLSNQASGGTVTLNSNLSISNTLELLTNNYTFAGSYGLSCGVFSCTSTSAVTLTLKEAITYTVTSALTANTTRNGSSLLFTSSHASTKAILTLQNGATCNCLADFGRIDASNGRPIRTFNGTVTDCINVQEFHDLKTITSVG